MWTVCSVKIIVKRVQYVRCDLLPVEVEAQRDCSHEEAEQQHEVE